MFYTTQTDDGAIAVTCDLCLVAAGCPDPWAAAAITRHRCDPDQAIRHPAEDAPPQEATQQPAALHLLASRLVASCPACGFQLATAQRQARCERRAARTTCPVCREDA